MLRHLSKLLALLLFSSSAPAEIMEDGPLLTRSESLGQLFRLNPPLQNPKVLDRGAIRFDISRSYANLWAKDKRFVVDGEIADDQSHLAVGLGAQMQLGVALSSRRFVEADTDQVAISFHDLFHMGQDGRLEAGKHHTRFVIPDYSLEYSHKNLDRTFSEQAVVDLSFSILRGEGGSYDLTLTGLLAHELAQSSPLAVKSVDRGLVLSAQYRWLSWNFFGNLRQLNFQEQSGVLQGARLQNQGLAFGAVYHLPKTQEVIWQFMNNQPVFRDLGQLSRNSYEWQLGYRYHWDKVSLELALIENVFWLYNSPDWGYSLGLQSYLSL